MIKLKHIDLNKPSFEANGKTYYIETSDLSIERWAKYEELVLEMQYGVNQVEMFNQFAEITKLANNLQFADIAILAHNMQNGMLTVMERQPVALKICAIFINEEDEDRGAINDAVITQKITDWSEEGYSIGPFFQLALVFSKLISENSNILSPQSLEAVSKQLEQLNETMISVDKKDQV